MLLFTSSDQGDKSNPANGKKVKGPRMNGYYAPFQRVSKGRTALRTRQHNAVPRLSQATDDVIFTSESRFSRVRNEHISQPRRWAPARGSQLSSLADSNYGGKQYKWALRYNEMLARVSHRAFNRA